MLSTIALLLIVATVSVGVVNAEPYYHGTSGFATSRPSQWAVNAKIDGVELSNMKALISIERIGTNKGEISETLSLFVPNVEGKSLNTPYPSLRASIQDNGYNAEVVILKTPIGFYLLSLEQSTPDQASLDTFESILKSFELLDTPPVSNLIDLLSPVNLGPIDLALPEGELTVEPGYLLWKSNAAGFLTAEVVKAGNGQLAQRLEAWEKAMLNADTGLSTRTSMLELTVEDRLAVQADYSGEKMQARVQVSAIDKSNVLVLALIARKETFASHQPVLDAVSFSVVPSDDSSGTIVLQPAQTVRYNEVIEAVSDRLFLDAESVNALFQKKPTLFKNIKTTLKDIAALDGTLSTSVEKLAGQTSWRDQTSQPQELRELFAALRSYKVSMAMLPKDVQTSALPENMLKRYVDTRNSQSAVNAYSRLLEDKVMLKERDNIHSQLLAEKKKTSDGVTEEMSKYLQGKADLYWRNRLEANYQLSRARSNREAIVDALWQQRANDVQRIKDAISK